MSLLHRLLPQYCLLCAQSKPQRYGCCTFCLQLLPRVSRNRCPVCALPTVHEESHSDLMCGHCQSHNPAYDTIITPFYYKQPASYLITSYKFNNRLSLARPLSEMIADEVSQFYQRKNLPELILPIPLHYQRLHHRGFNQAILLGKYLSKRFEIPLCRHTVKRVIYTSPQQSLPQKLRAKNVRRAFALHKLPKITHVALLDDVVTSGATVHEVSLLLKSSGIQRVDVWCYARTLKYQDKIIQ